MTTCPACNPKVPGAPAHSYDCPVIANFPRPGCKRCKFTGFRSERVGRIVIDQPCDCWKGIR